MSDWSTGESATGWGTEGSDTESDIGEADAGWDTDDSDAGWNVEESDSETGVERIAGRHILPTLRWAVSVLRHTPLLLALAVAASSLELYVFQSNSTLFTAWGGLLRWGVTFLGIVLVAAFVAVVAKDIAEQRTRALRAQVLDVLRSLPALLVTAVVFGFVLYFGVALPAMFVPIPGIAFGLVVVYLLSLLGFVFPAVVLDRSGRDEPPFAPREFSRSNCSAYSPLDTSRSRFSHRRFPSHSSQLASLCGRDW